MSHEKKEKAESGPMEFGFDYCFPGNEFGHKLTIRVGKEPAAETLGPASRASREDEAARLRSAFQGLPYEEVARGTGSTLKQARLRVLKAKLRLAEALRNR